MKVKKAQKQAALRAKLLEAAPSQHLNFELVREWITGRYASAKKLADKTPYFSPLNVLKRDVYEYVRELDDAGKLRKLRKYVIAQDKLPRGTAHDNPFLWGLRLVQDPKQIAILSKQNRSKYATLMWYAHQHDVPSRQLEGFLVGAGPYALVRKKLKDELREEWYTA